jgi:hypothetical protein
MEVLCRYGAVGKHRRCRYGHLLPAAVWLDLTRRRGDVTPPLRVYANAWSAGCLLSSPDFAGDDLDGGRCAVYEGGVQYQLNIPVEQVGAREMG